MKITKKKTVKKTTARKTDVKRTPIKKPVSRTTTKRKTTPKKVVRKAPVKRTVARKTNPATRKPVVRKTTVKKTVAKRNSARAGEFWTVNDAKTKGHKSLLTKRTKNGVVYHIPTTHSPKTRKMNNIPLQKNPQKNKKEKAYVLPKLQKTKIKNLGKKQSNMKIRNKRDKSIVRKIKKQKIR